jgi:hypothetical protein
VPSRAVIAQNLERPDETLEALEEYYGPSYGSGLYPVNRSASRPSAG